LAVESIGFIFGLCFSPIKFIQFFEEGFGGRLHRFPVMNRDDDIVAVERPRLDTFGVEIRFKGETGRVLKGDLAVGEKSFLVRDERGGGVLEMALLWASLPAISRTLWLSRRRV
jgi:hypothetical protein